jgi:hypothetical protein
MSVPFCFWMSVWAEGLSKGSYQQHLIFAGKKHKMIIIGVKSSTPSTTWVLVRFRTFSDQQDLNFTTKQSYSLWLQHPERVDTLILQLSTVNPWVNHPTSHYDSVKIIFYKTYIVCNVSNQLTTAQLSRGTQQNKTQKTQGWGWGYVSPLLSGAAPCGLALPSLMLAMLFTSPQCHASAWQLLLSSSPTLVLTMGCGLVFASHCCHHQWWCCHHQLSYGSRRAPGHRL